MKSSRRPRRGEQAQHTSELIELEAKAKPKKRDQSKMAAHKQKLAGIEFALLAAVAKLGWNYRRSGERRWSNDVI